MKKIFFCLVIFILSFWVLNAWDFWPSYELSNDFVWPPSDLKNSESTYSWDPNSPDFVWPPAPSDLDWSNYSWWCTYREWASLSSFLNWCKPKTVVWWWTMTIEWWFKDKINDWIQYIALILWVWAVWALVYAAILLQLSGGEDEQIKKAKNIVKWTIIWFLLLVSASWIIYIVINVMIGLWWS
jgi:hypothetical protein